MTEVGRYPGRELEPTFPATIGHDVLLVQSRLAELGSVCADLPGYPVPRTEGAAKADIAGVYGRRTVEAVREYQDKRGLKIDGVVGSNTWQALFGPPQPLHTSVPGAEVDPRKTDTDLTKLHPVMRERVLKLIDLLTRRGIPMRLFETFRSPERQQHLISGTGKAVTQAGPFKSYHQYGLAVDMVIAIPGREWDNKSAEGIAWYEAYRNAGLEAGLVAGPRWDWPHLQFPGVSISGLQSGEYPGGGDDAWADNFAAAIMRWRGARRPPLPKRLERPPLAETPTPRDGGEPIEWASLPQLAAIDWKHPYGGRRWRVDAKGVYLRSHAGGAEPLISEGTPDTCSDIIEFFGRDIARASARHGVPPEILIMIIATETGSFRRSGFTGPQTFRWEPGVTDYSAGPMQILSATARDVNRTAKLGYKESDFPAIDRRPDPIPDDLPLYRGDIALDVGAAFLAQKMKKLGANPILLSAAYNAGDVYRSENAWGLRCHGDHLDRAAEWFGDACRLLRSD